MGYEDNIGTLLEEYKRIFSDKEKQPTWAFHKVKNPDELIHPTIPFVGKKYSQQNKKFLVYASAEVLSDYKGWLDDDEIALNRHRNWFEKENGDFFPSTHCKPFTDGGLTLAIKYIIYKLGLLNDVSINPRQFYELISFANIGKFTIEGKINRDYAYDWDKLNSSLEYIKADIRVLKPDIIICPYKTKQFLRKYLGKEFPNIKFLEIYQINSRVVNVHLKKFIVSEDKMEQEYRQFEDWVNSVHSLTQKNVWHLFPYLENQLKIQGFI